MQKRFLFTVLFLKALAPNAYMNEENKISQNNMNNINNNKCDLTQIEKKAKHLRNALNDTLLNLQGEDLRIEMNYTIDNVVLDVVQQMFGHTVVPTMIFYILDNFFSSEVKELYSLMHMQCSAHHSNTHTGINTNIHAHTDVGAGDNNFSTAIASTIVITLPKADGINPFDI